MKMNKDIQVIPAIIPEDFEYLKNSLAQLRGKVSRVQIDVVDGIYVPSISWPYKDREDKDFKKMVSQDEGMPFWQDFDFDIDMMISNPEEEYMNWVNAGASCLIFHLESLKGNKVEFIKKVKKETGLTIAIAIQTKTPNEELEPFLDIVDFVQFMGIAKIGYQGQEFDEKVLEKIQDLRFKNQDIDIAVDGSVNFDTADRLVDQGANMLVSGSAILKAEDVEEAINDMKNLCE
jgi:ribulose-phosphate 3-epimerase